MLKFSGFADLTSCLERKRTHSKALRESCVEQARIRNSATKETHRVLIKLLVADATSALNASRAEAP